MECGKKRTRNLYGHDFITSHLSKKTSNMTYISILNNIEYNSLII
jgi:hypothetical protein